MVHSAHLCWDLARISATGWDSQTHNPPVPAYVSSNDTGRRGGENRVRKSRFLGLPGGPCLSHSSDPIAWVKGLPFKDYVYSLQQLLVVLERERFINPFLSVKISLSRNRILDGEIGFTSCERKIERTIEGSDLIIIRNGIYIYIYAASRFTLQNKLDGWNGAARYRSWRARRWYKQVERFRTVSTGAPVSLCFRTSRGRGGDFAR